MLDLDTGAFLYSKNCDRQLYPASITKIMTCLLTLENADLDAVMTCSPIVYELDENASNVGLSEGEQMTIRDALYTLMLESANDTANALAEYVGGSMEGFAQMMNDRAAALGCTGTHFSNPSGLSADDHYTTAHDYALIAAEAYRNEGFRTICATVSYDVPDRNDLPAQRFPQNSLINPDLIPDEEIPREEYILCGRNPIREALKNGREIEKLLVQKGELSSSALEIIREARDRKIIVQEADKHRLDEISLHHQGLIAFTTPYKYVETDEILKAAKEKGEDPFLIILDGITDPHNLGAVIRTAECAGAHGVIIPAHRSVGLTPSAIKASAGAVEHIRIAKVTNLNRTIDELKQAGVWTYAVTMQGEDYEEVDFRGGVALVIGAEGDGISRLTEEKCDQAVSLPMKGKIDSLNASVAAGIIMYRVLACRRKTNK